MTGEGGREQASERVRDLLTPRSLIGGNGRKVITAVPL